MPEVLKAQINYKINPSVQHWCLKVGRREEQKGSLVDGALLLPFKQRGSNLFFILRFIKISMRNKFLYSLILGIYTTV